MKRKLTKEQAAIAERLKNNDRAFFLMSEAEQGVMLLWDGKLLWMHIHQGCWIARQYIGERLGGTHRLPADAEWEVVEDEPEFVDVPVSVDAYGRKIVGNPNSVIPPRLTAAPNICGPDWAFHRFVVKVRFRRVAGGAE